MKVLLTLFDIQDYGGIVGDIEFLIRGLRENDYEADLILLRDTTKPVYTKQLKYKQGSYQSNSGVGHVHTLDGWSGIPVWSFHTEQHVQEYHQFAKAYDLIIHEIPNPPQTGAWREIYDINTPQVIAAHDAHYRRAYPYIAEIAHLVRGISCTNHAGYVALAEFPGPRAFIGAAHEVMDWPLLPTWRERKKQAVCAHVWKNWKHMDRVVAAAPYLLDSSLIMAGDGIERRYMASLTKCKPKYIGLWQTFNECSWAEYAGMLPYEELFATYQNSRVMVDMSYSDKFASLGNHFNRSIIEAFNNGCVSICTDMNMRENTPQVPLFEKDETHIEVPYDITPEDLADVIDDTVNMPAKRANRIIENGREILLKYFNYEDVWEEYFKLARGEPAGIYPVLEVGKQPCK